MHCNAYPVDPARFRNASGAGDTAVAAFLSGIIDGMSPELTLKYTAMAGRNNLYSDDIYTDLADWEEMGIEIEADNGSPITNLKSKSIIQ
jgi:fructose-1-phosphate kinase PfkB-like protein